MVVVLFSALSLGNYAFISIMETSINQMILFCSCFIYPDTSSKKMPETLLECEAMATTNFFCKLSKDKELESTTNQEEVRNLLKQTVTDIESKAL